MGPQRSGLRARTIVVTTAAAVLASVATVATVAGSGVRAEETENDVAEWISEVDPEMVVDESGDCMAGATDPVYYHGNRIVLRSAMSDNAARTVVNNALQSINGGPSVAWATTVERITFPHPPVGPQIKPVLSVSLAPRPDGKPHPVVALARALRLDPGVESSPDIALTPAVPYSFFWPNGYPRPVADVTPPRTNVTPGGLPVGSGVEIVVYDTGLTPGAPGELPNVVQLGPLDDEQIDRNADGLADYPAAGHGRAIAGVIATLAPGAAVTEARISARTGLATDVSAARRIAASLRNNPRQTWPSIIVNSFGGASCDFDPKSPGLQLEPVGLRAVVEVSNRFDPFQPDGLLIVASAGNQDSDRPVYPAAFESVLAVGALDGTIDADGSPWTSTTRTGPKASFSNYGSWVDAWVHGVALPTYHVTGVAFEQGLPVLGGKAEVDGTSFAGPALAALIAERMSVTGLDARDAWAQIEASGTAPLPECGGKSAPDGVAVALASLDPTTGATTPGWGKPVGC
jgi:hypothetical protein